MTTPPPGLRPFALRTPRAPLAIVWGHSYASAKDAGVGAGLITDFEGFELSEATPEERRHVAALGLPEVGRPKPQRRAFSGQLLGKGLAPVFTRAPAGARLRCWRSRLQWRPAKLRRLHHHTLALELARFAAEQKRRRRTP